MVSPRFRDVKDKDEMERTRDDFMTQGYTVKEEGQLSLLMKKKSWGSAAGWIVSLVVAVILAIFTVGLSFIIPLGYAIFAHYNAAEVLIRIV
jgi:hypothetical protein